MTRLTLGTDEILLVRLPVWTTQEEMRKLHKALSRAMGAAAMKRVVICCGDIEWQVVKKSEL